MLRDAVETLSSFSGIDLATLERVRHGIHGASATGGGKKTG
jgi:hypothetical protein